MASAAKYQSIPKKSTFQYLIMHVHRIDSFEDELMALMP